MPLSRVSLAHLLATVLAAAAMGACTDSRPSATWGPSGPLGSPTSTATALPASGDGGPSDAAVPAIAPEVVCAKVTHGASGVEEVAEPGVPPEPSGGTILPGRYALSQVVSYVPDGGGPTGYFARKTLLFVEGGAYAFLESDGNTTDGVGPSTVTGGTFTVQQTKLVLNQVCPSDGAGATQTFSFSAAPTRLAIRRGERWEIYQRK